jgi:hypothetical protein
VAKSGFWDGLFGAAKTAKDADEFKAAVMKDDLVDPGMKRDDDDGDTHIHLHMNGAKKEGAMDDDPDLDPDMGEGGAPDLATLASQVAELTQRVAQLEAMDEEDVELEDPDTQDARTFKLRRGTKMGRARSRDEDTETTPERNPDMVAETDLPGIEDLDKRMPTASASDKRRFRDKWIRTTDSADSEDVWKETMALAEIIQPGIRIPTFDARISIGRTADRLCSFRRRVLDHALKDEDTSPVVKDLLGDINPEKLSCSSVKLSFNALGSHMRASNNTNHVRHAVRDGATKTGDNRNTTSGPPTISQMNQNAKEFWKAQKTNGATH